eukprot:3768641-Lingulodinium_polyedra.AAC.1
MRIWKGCTHLASWAKSFSMFRLRARLRATAARRRGRWAVIRCRTDQARHERLARAQIWWPARAFCSIAVA